MVGLTLVHTSGGPNMTLWYWTIADLRLKDIQTYVAYKKIRV